MKNEHDIELRCRCGQVRGVIRDIDPTHATHCVCMCDDCQAYAKFLGSEGLVDENGGTDIVQVPHNRLVLTEGRENVACIRLSGKGMHRWYARCCNTPIANTLGPKSVFAGVCRPCMVATSKGEPIEVAVGPIAERMQGKFGKGNLPPGTRQTISPRMMWHAGGRMFRWWLSKSHENSTFFRDGKPFVQPKVLDAAERRALD